jgi:hypothetical protein
MCFLRQVLVTLPVNTGRADDNTLELTATALRFAAICALEETFAVAGV